MAKLHRQYSRGTRRRPWVERLEDRRLLAAWQNPDIPLDVDATGLVTPLDVLLVINDLNAGGARRLSGNPPAGQFVRYVDVNGDDFITPLDALSVINALNQNGGPLNLVLSVAPEDDPNGNGVVLLEQVEVRGQTAERAKIVVTVAPLDALLHVVDSQQRSQQVVADSSGRFSVRPELSVGLNLLTAVATDELGRQLAVTREIVRGDIVADWNAALLNVVRDWTTTSNDPYQGRIVPSAPPVVARNLAMVHAALFDGLNGITGQYAPYVVTQAAEPDASVLAAGASAAHDVAMALYPGMKEAAVWRTTLAESLRGIPDGPSKQAGIDYGRMVAAAVLTDRADDGSNSPANYAPGGQPGGWNRTAPDYLPPLVPHWGSVRPMAVGDVADYRPSAPPELTSSQYADAVDEVMRLGHINSAERTPEQTEIALFWADGGGTATPPGHWNRIATRISLHAQQSTVDRARTLALLNLALADAAIVSWDAKYTYDLWRPIDAIRRAAEDGNAATVADATWLPLIRTPPFPTYTSGHSTFSGAGASVLSAIFGRDNRFASRSDGHTGLTQRPLSSVMTRTFDSFWDAAEEAGMSRIYGGIHFQFDNTSGLAAGRAVGDHVVANWLQART